MKYGMTADEWAQAKAEVRAILIGVAQLETTITYGELAAQMTTMSPHPGAYAFHALLRDVCYDEHQAGRGMLCAVVVSKASSMPGQGFFKALMKRGIDCQDQRACWQDAIARLYAIWS
ncbi:MAG: hypothetical protein ACFE0Q_19860 [Anaerolineae bacterium]